MRGVLNHPRLMVTHAIASLRGAGGTKPPPVANKKPLENWCNSRGFCKKGKQLMEDEITHSKPNVNRFTNKQNLPRPVFLALSEENYNPGNSWRTVTELIDPPRLVHLKRKYRDRLTEDVADRVYTFQGEVVHSIIERATKTLAHEGWESERRVFKEIRGRLISGQFDLYHEPSGELIDVKYSNAYKAKKNECPKEWEEQLNCLAALIRSEGKVVNKAGICFFIRDFHKSDAMKDPDYPQYSALYLPAKLWGKDEADFFLDDRVRLHLLTEEREVFCSPEERWAKPDTWAIKKRGTTRAIAGGIYADEMAARRALNALGVNYMIEERPGSYTRCEGYCLVRDFCTQFKGEKHDNV